MKLTINEDFHCGTHLFSFSHHKIILFEKKYDTKFITLISMYHLKPLASLGRFIRNESADPQIALRIETVPILCITIFQTKILFYVV